MKLRILLIISFILLFSALGFSAPITAYIPDFKVTGTSGDEGVKQGMQALLASRLSSDQIKIVNQKDSPQVIVSVNYIVFGKVFSLDAQITGADGKILGSAFEQGESTDQVIPSVGRLADKLKAQIKSIPSADLVASSVVVQTMPQNGAADKNNPEPVAEPKKSDSDIVRPERMNRSPMDKLIGARIDGVMIGLSMLSDNDPNKRKLAVASEREIQLYEQDDNLHLLTFDDSFSSNEKILNIDSGDLNSDGTQELYVTVIKGQDLSSRVYEIKDNKLTLIAGNLEYYFRKLTGKDGVARIYAQEMGRDDDFYGGIYEVVRNGKKFKMKNQIKLPRYGNVYNVSFFKGKDGEQLLAMIHPDGYLEVYNEKNDRIWKSSDKFGGSEMFFTRPDPNIRLTGTDRRKVYIEQRITVTKDGEIILPRNEGFFNTITGNIRSYSKNSIYAFRWNGAYMDEEWHTKINQNYLSDYQYDEPNRELILLEVVTKAGILEKGASAISVKRIE